jgi:hypothetical protein
VERCVVRFTCGRLWPRDHCFVMVSSRFNRTRATTV